MRVGMNGMHFELAARMKQRLQSRGETLIKHTRGKETTSTIQRRDIDQTRFELAARMKQCLQSRGETLIKLIYIANHR